MAGLIGPDEMNLRHNEAEKLKEYRASLNVLENKLFDAFKSPEVIRQLDKLNSAAAPFLKAVNNELENFSEKFREIYSCGDLKASLSFSSNQDRFNRSGYQVNVGFDQGGTIFNFYLTSTGRNNDLHFRFPKTDNLRNEDLEKIGHSLESLSKMYPEDFKIIATNIIKQAHLELQSLAFYNGFDMKGPNDDVKLVNNLCLQRFSDEDFREIMKSYARQSYDKSLINKIDYSLQSALKVADYCNLKLYDFAVIDNNFYGIAQRSEDPVVSYCLIDCEKAKIFKSTDLPIAVTNIKINPEIFDYSTNISDVQSFLVDKLNENPKQTLKDSIPDALSIVQLLLDQSDLMLKDIVVISDRFYPVCSKYETDLNRIDDRYIVNPAIVKHLPIQNFKEALIRVS